jgi:hypothetical protein
VNDFSQKSHLNCFSDVLGGILGDWLVEAAAAEVL